VNLLVSNEFIKGLTAIIVTVLLMAAGVYLGGYKLIFGSVVNVLEVAGGEVPFDATVIAKNIFFIFIGWPVMGVFCWLGATIGAVILVLGEK